MLAPAWKAARDIRNTRLRRGLSQRQLASLGGFRQPYLVQVEKGVRGISLKYARILEGILEVKSGRFSKGCLGRGRQQLAPMTRAALRQLRQGLRQFWAPSRAIIPEYPQPHRVRRQDDPLWPMSIHLGECAGQEVRQLELVRAKDSRFWRDFNSLRFDSWSEKRLLVKLALLPCDLTTVRLKDLGCTLPIVNGETGAEQELHLGFVLKEREASIVWCPQVAVQAGNYCLCPDNVLVVSGRGRHVTAVVEVNGAPHHGDLRKQRWRDGELGVPVLHVDASRIGEPGLLGEILSWAAGLLSRE